MSFLQLPDLFKKHKVTSCKEKEGDLQSILTVMELGANEAILAEELNQTIELLDVFHMLTGMSLDLVKHQN